MTTPASNTETTSSIRVVTTWLSPFLRLSRLAILIDLYSPSFLIFNKLKVNKGDIRAAKNSTAEAYTSKKNRKGLSQVVTTLILLVVSVLLAGVVTYYATN
ncbi:MAG: hypothetical protein NWE87_00080, partial [Candidatus Bathyarchaeota archaeon]|nr:hypothetical protein [Candidatus Bathyarchaeota archaeon]